MQGSIQEQITRHFNLAYLQKALAYWNLEKRIKENARKAKLGLGCRSVVS